MNLRVLGPALLFLFFSTPAFAEWTWLHPKPQGHTLSDVEFLDDDTAIAVGAAGTVMVTHDAGHSTLQMAVFGGRSTRCHAHCLASRPTTRA